MHNVVASVGRLVDESCKTGSLEFDKKVCMCCCVVCKFVVLWFVFLVFELIVLSDDCLVAEGD